MKKRVALVGAGPMMTLPIAGHSRSTLVVEVKNTLIASNMLEVKRIEEYQHRHSGLTINQAAQQWIARNAASWRRRHPLLGV